jgi:hypothetical protein
MKTYGGVDALIHVFLTSALLGGSGQLQALVAIPNVIQPLVSFTQEARWTLDNVQKRKFLSIF